MTTMHAERVPVRAPAGPARGGDRAVVRLAGRLVRRSTLVMALSVAGYVALEMAGYLKAYPDAASRARIAAFAEVGVARALQGEPHGVDTVGGFVAWDGGWVLGLLVGVWVVLQATRFLRGDEDEDRAHWVLGAPVRAPRVVVLQLAVLLGAAVVVTAAMTLTLLAGGAEPAGSLLLGVAYAGFAATYLGVAAVAAQVFGLRRRAVAAAGTALGAAFAVRMVADASDGRGWLRLLTPFGWLEELQPFAERRWAALLPLAVTPVVLVAVAAVLRRRRDLGAGLAGGADRRPPHLRLLGSAAGQAWRSGEGVLLAWMLGLGAYAFAMGSVARSMADHLAGDPDLRRTLESMGMGRAVTAEGFVGVLSVVLAVGFALYGCWRVAAARAEEAAGRAELVLSRRTTRTRWLLGRLAGDVTAVAVVLLGGAAGLWAGTAVGGGQVSPGAALKAAANTAPVVLLFLGLAVLVLAVAPRLAAVLPPVLVVGAYLLQVLGPPLDLPGRVVDLSPFRHLAYVPAEPFAAGDAAWLLAVGLAATAVGLAVFRRRDLRGA